MRARHSTPLLAGAGGLESLAGAARRARLMGDSLDVSRRFPFRREPSSLSGQLPVFVPEGELAERDDYASENPYRDDETRKSVWDRFRIQTALASLQGTNVLDAGCGEGEITEHLRASSEALAIAAFDVSLTAASDAVKRVPRVEFCVADALDLPYCDALFDSVVALNLFEHVESPCALVREVRRVLRPGGRLILSTPSRYRTENFRRVLRGRPVVFNSPHHITEYTPGQVRELLEHTGFKLVSARSNLICRTLLGTAFARSLAGAAALVGSDAQFGDPTLYVADRVG